MRSPFGVDIAQPSGEMSMTGHRRGRGIQQHLALSRNDGQRCRQQAVGCNSLAQQDRA
jgi:hypothetical protein